jgi:hypothetical protein
MTKINLDDIARKIKSTLGTGSNGPLIVAIDVEALENTWQEYKEESGGFTLSQWLVGICGAGKTIAWWRRRADAVRRIGEESRRQLNHEVAVYVLDNVTDEHLVDVRKMLYLGTKQNGGIPYTLGQATRRIAEITGRNPRVKTCSNCRRLEALLVRFGIDPATEDHFPASAAVEETGVGKIH